MSTMATNIDVRWYIASGAIPWAIFAASCATSSTRYMVQREKYGKLLVEDYVHISALFFCAIHIFTFFVGITDGLASELPDIGDEPAKVAFRANAVATSTYIVTIFAAKAVFLAMYQRLFGVSRRFRMAWWATAFILGSTSLAAFILQFFQCGDIRRFHWDDPSCYSPPQNALVGSTAVVPLIGNCLTDLLLTILPLVMIYRSRMLRARKIRLTPIFALGLFTIIFDLFSLLPQINVTYQNGKYARTGYVFQGSEPPVAVIIASLPAILAPKLGKSVHSEEPTEDEEPRLSQNRWLIWGRAGRAGGRAGGRRGRGHDGIDATDVLGSTYNKTGSAPTRRHDVESQGMGIGGSGTSEDRDVVTSSDDRDRERERDGSLSSSAFTSLHSNSRGATATGGGIRGFH